MGWCSVTLTQDGNTGPIRYWVIPVTNHDVIVPHPIAGGSGLSMSHVTTWINNYMEFDITVEGPDAMAFAVSGETIGC